MLAARFRTRRSRTARCSYPDFGLHARRTMMFSRFWFGRKQHGVFIQILVWTLSARCSSPDFSLDANSTLHLSKSWFGRDQHGVLLQFLVWTRTVRCIYPNLGLVASSTVFLFRFWCAILTASIWSSSVSTFFHCFFHTWPHVQSPPRPATTHTTAQSVINISHWKRVSETPGSWLVYHTPRQSL